MKSKRPTRVKLEESNSKVEKVNKKKGWTSGGKTKDWAFDQVKAQGPIAQSQAQFAPRTSAKIRRVRLDPSPELNEHFLSLKLFLIIFVV